MDQIINEAAKLRYRSNNDFGCPIVIRVPYGGGITGGLYHSQSVEALFFSTPGLKIVAPTTPADVKGLLRAAIADPDPVIFLEHKASYRTIKGEYPEGDYIIPIGGADIKRAGNRRDRRQLRHDHALRLGGCRRARSRRRASKSSSSTSGPSCRWTARRSSSR